MTRVLFVCPGNICRSPLAEGIFRKIAAKNDLFVEVGSAGTGSWVTGNAPDARAIVAARAHDVAIDGLRARTFGAFDFDEFDLILVADRETLADVMRFEQRSGNAKVDMLTKYSSRAELINMDIPDPYYTGHFDPVIAIIEDCVNGLVSYLKEEQDRSAADA